jgi:phosphoserine phosphatase RsbU/P
MNARRLRYARWFLIVVSLMILSGSLGAQEQASVVDATRMGEPLTLDQGWRFHIGDDAQWSSPAYDDSAWQSFDTHKTLSAQGFPDYHGFVWVRIHLRLPPTHGLLSLLLDRAGNSYQVFVDGQSIGNYGSLSSATNYVLPAPVTYPLKGAASGETAVLALRFWRPKYRSIAMIGPHTVMIGPVAAIAAFRTAIRSTQVIQQFDDIIVALIGLLIGCGLIGLFFAQRDHTEYLWIGVSLALIGCYYAVNILAALGVISIWSYFLLCFPAGYGGIVAGVEFLYRFNDQRPGPWTRIYQGVVLACGSLGILAAYGLVNGLTLNLTAGIMILSYAVLSAVLLIVWYIRGKREAAILVLPVVLFGLTNPLDFFSDVAYLLGWTRTPDGLVPDLHFGPVHFVFSSVTTCLYMLSFVGILAFRFLHTSREQQRSAAELAAAHRVQSRLVPVTFPALGRFSMEAAYVAATEVGGDFYQVFPETDGGLLFFIGDVSGKGLSAAMVGTLIVGAIRTLAAQQLSPARSLALLNQQLAGQTDGGFVTCLCARISAAGTMVIANAGHLAPYVDGKGIELENGLPLGISSMADYTEQEVVLPNSARLTFISDGVVEAKNAQHELLGFARTQELSVLSAAAIAQAAQSYGQADDITVVTIQLAPGLP